MVFTSYFIITKYLICNKDAPAKLDFLHFNLIKKTMKPQRAKYKVDNRQPMGY